jgi:hypothetical protein
MAVVHIVTLKFRPETTESVIGKLAGAHGVCPTPKNHQGFGDAAPTSTIGGAVRRRRLGQRRASRVI